MGVSGTVYLIPGVVPGTVYLIPVSGKQEWGIILGIGMIYENFNGTGGSA